jgi:hypothetical protein
MRAEAGIAERKMKIKRERTPFSGKENKRSR